MSDLILRQQVTIALRESGLCYNNWLEVLGVIDAVPNTKEHIKNGDLISREQAIDAVIAEGRNVFTSEYANAERIIYEADAVEVLAMLPSADIPTGEWIEVTNGRGGHECSECHSYAPSYASGDEHLSDYCPNCGVKMGGESDG